jgi:uncharacterized protein YraI
MRSMTPEATGKGSRYPPAAVIAANRAARTSTAGCALGSSAGYAGSSGTTLTTTVEAPAGVASVYRSSRRSTRTTGDTASPGASLTETRSYDAEEWGEATDQLGRGLFEEAP